MKTFQTTKEQLRENLCEARKYMSGLDLDPATWDGSAVAISCSTYTKRIIETEENIRLTDQMLGCRFTTDPSIPNGRIDYKSPKGECAVVIA